ncbi:MAG: DUF4352 domain-containing protein, partial [Candidatus Saccharimonadales bacterium]
LEEGCYMSKDKTGNWFGRHKILSTIGALIVLAIIISAVTSGNGSNSNQTKNAASSSNSPASKPSASPSVAKLNQPASDGKFQFVVTAFKCGQSEVSQPDSPDIMSQAQGQFCTMNLTVKNTGTVAQTFDDTAQYVYNSTNTQYSDSSDGTITANSSGSQFAFYESVNPGVSVSGVVVFDVPKGVTPSYAMLHDSSASNGVKVNLQ